MWLTFLPGQSWPTICSSHGNHVLQYVPVSGCPECGPWPPAPPRPAPSKPMPAGPPERLCGMKDSDIDKYSRYQTKFKNSQLHNPSGDQAVTIFKNTALVGLMSISQVLLLLASYSLYLHFSGLYFLSRSSASTWCIGQYISQFLTPQSTTWSTWTLINMIKRTEPRQLSEYNKQTSFQLTTIGEIELLTWGCLDWIAPNCEW